MKLLILFLSTIVMLGSCSKTKKSPAQVEEQILQTGKVDSLYHTFPPKDTFAIYHYLDTIAYRITDSLQVIQLAKSDVSNGAYFLMEFGMVSKVQPLNPDPAIYLEQQSICKENNIWIFNMGCDDSEPGRIYTREVKKLLKQKKGIDFDSIFNPSQVTL